MWDKIVNPVSGKKVTIYGKVGENVLKNYLFMIGGSSVSIPKSKVETSEEIISRIKNQRKKLITMTNKRTNKEVVKPPITQKVANAEYDNFYEPDFTKKIFYKSDTKNWIMNEKKISPPIWAYLYNHKESTERFGIVSKISLEN